MRQVLQNALLSLITGLCFGAGVFAAFGIYKAVQEARAPIRVDQPQGFDFPHHERLPDQPRFTVSGTLRYAGDRQWSSVRIVTSIYAGTAYMTSCWSDLGWVPPRSTRPFEVVCKSTEGVNVPENVTYRLSVPWAIVTMPR
jgi:hypothetical protein